jgi:8-oxo-dGTP diphosphatase
MQQSAFQPWDSFRPDEDATLLFIVEADRILLIRKKRGLGAGKITGPGGRIEPGEGVVGAAIRELEEEVCVTTPNAVRVGELNFQFSDGYALRVYVLRSEERRGEPRETDEALPIWAPLDAVPYSEIWADDIHWLPLLIAGRSFRGRFKFDGDRLLDHELEVADTV